MASNTAEARYLLRHALLADQLNAAYAAVFDEQFRGEFEFADGNILQGLALA